MYRVSLYLSAPWERAKNRNEENVNFEHENTFYLCTFWKFPENYLHFMSLETFFCKKKFVIFVDLIIDFRNYQKNV